MPGKFWHLERPAGNLGICGHMYSAIRALCVQRLNSLIKMVSISAT